MKPDMWDNLLKAAKQAQSRLETLVDADEATDNDIDALDDLKKAIDEIERKY